MLAELFGGSPVMAVGDPNQSIYGWRGASAANLDQFATLFRAEGRYALSTSWRNGTGILAAANELVAPFRGRGVPVEQLAASPTASHHPVEVVFGETVAEEAAAVADWFAARLRVPAGEDPPSAAMLLRTRATQPYFLAALRERGIPFHVLGIGDGRVTKHVRMTTFHLLANRVGDIVETEGALLRRHLRMKHDLKQQIAQLVP